jgi:hypothetical protein
MDSPNNTKSYNPPVQLLQKSKERVITAYVLAQMPATADIKIYSQPAVDAIFKEFCQRHDKGSLTYSTQLCSPPTKNLVPFVLSTSSKQNAQERSKSVPALTVVSNALSLTNWKQPLQQLL